MLHKTLIESSTAWYAEDDRNKRNKQRPPDRDKEKSLAIGEVPDSSRCLTIPFYSFKLQRSFVCQTFKCLFNCF